MFRAGLTASSQQPGEQVPIKHGQRSVCHQTCHQKLKAVDGGPLLETATLDSRRSCRSRRRRGWDACTWPKPQHLMIRVYESCHLSWLPSLSLAYQLLVMVYVIHCHFGCRRKSGMSRRDSLMIECALKRTYSLTRHGCPSYWMLSHTDVVVWPVARRMPWWSE